MATLANISWGQERELLQRALWVPKKAQCPTSRDPEDENQFGFAHHRPILDPEVTRLGSLELLPAHSQSRAASGGALAVHSAHEVETANGRGRGEAT